MTICAFILCVALLCLMPEDVKAGDGVQSLKEKMIYQAFKNPYAVARNTKIRSGWINLDKTLIEETHKSSETEDKTEKPKVVEIVPDMTKLDSNVLVIKVAALFRNNLIKCFGYILHRPKMELNSDLYTSLYFILSTLKLNQVNVLSMVPILKEISFKSSNERFLKIFEEMEKHLPRYLICAAAFWKDAINKKEVNMDNILKPDATGPLKVDVLEGMNDEILGKVANEEKIEGTKNKNEEKILYNFNMNIVQIMRYIQKHKNNIHQIFFGALVLFFPRRIQPDLEESIQVLTEFLQQNEVVQWKTYISELDTSKTENPYFVVKEILNKLLLDNSTTIVIKESLQIVLSNLENRNPTAINPHYNSFVHIIDLQGTKINYTLNYIGRGAYPIEIVMAAGRIIYHLKKAHIKHLTLMTHFNQYIYSSPTEVTIALLDRIIKRQPDLPSEIIDAVGAVYAYLIFTYRYVELSATMPDDMLNLNILFLGIRSPDIEHSFVQQVTIIINLFTKDQVDFQKVLLEIPVYECTAPMVCFLELLRRLYIHKLVPSETMLLIETVVEHPCFRMQCSIEVVNDTLVPNHELLRIYNSTIVNSDEWPTTYSSAPSITPRPTTQRIPKPTTIATIAPPTEGPISPPTTLKSTLATAPTTVTASQIFPANVTQTAPTDASVLISIVQDIAQNQDADHVKKIIEVLTAPEFKTVYEKMQKNNQVLLISQLMVFLEAVADAQATFAIETEIRQYLLNYLQLIKHIQEVLKLITTEKQPTRPVLARLIVAVPAPMDNETAIFKQLSLLLQREDLFSYIADNIQKESFKNMGTLLQAVLTEELKLKSKLSEEEIKAAKYYVNKIQFLGFGQGKILWGVDVDVISQNINVAQIMDNAIDFKALDSAKRRQFNSIIVHLRSNPPILQTWDKWIYYTKCGDFTKALFRLLMDHGSTPPNVKTAITVLTPLINYDKNGEKPTFG